jgi:hypothetical protein
VHPLAVGSPILASLSLATVHGMRGHRVARAALRHLA